MIVCFFEKQVKPGTGKRVKKCKTGPFNPVFLLSA